MNTSTLPPRAPAVQATPAQDAYRAHVASDCIYCMHGHDCAERDILDDAAAAEDYRRDAARYQEARRGN